MEREIKFSYEYCPTIEEFALSDKFMRGLMGPFGSGKSSGCVAEIIRRGCAQAPDADGIRRTRWAVVRNTYGQLRDTTQKTFYEWVPPKYFGTETKSEHKYLIDKIPGVEIEILFKALDKPGDIANLLSLELTGAWVNEAREVPWTIIDALQGRVGRYPKKWEGGGPTWYGVIMDTNPPDDLSGWYKYFEEIRPENAAIFKQPSGLSEDAENIPYLPDGYYQNLSQGKDPEFIKIYVDGLYGFIIEGKPIYPEYNDSVHCKPCNPVKGVEIRRGWDFGLTPACTFSQILPSGRVIVFDELTADSMGVDRFSKRVLEHCQRRYPDFEFSDRGDPAGNNRSETDEKTCFQILRGKGIKIEGGDQTPTLRIECVKYPLTQMVDGLPALQIDPRCQILRRGFMGGYQYARLQTTKEKYSEKPDKNLYSHPHDALQYDFTGIYGNIVRGRDAKPKWEKLDYSHKSL